MANTYTKCYIHLVFAVQNRQALIHKYWQEDLEKYITQIIQLNHHKLLYIKAMPDHIHILIGYNVNQLIPDLVEKIKTKSDSWIKDSNLSRYKFVWQKGYGAFTHAHSQLNTVVHYIKNQEIHHEKQTFREEYLEMLRKNEIAFKHEYIFQFFDPVKAAE